MGSSWDPQEYVGPRFEAANGPGFWCIILPPVHSSPGTKHPHRVDSTTPHSAVIAQWSEGTPREAVSRGSWRAEPERSEGGDLQGGSPFHLSAHPSR